MTLLADNKRISQIVKILRKAVRAFDDPSVTMVSRRWHDPFRVLISCMLSQRTKDTTTIPASERLFALADCPEKFLTLSAKKIEQAIFPVGFYRTKAKSIKSVCRVLVNKFQAKVPDDIDTLLTLQGVGRKTANLVLTEGFGKLAICVDTHVHRISNRLDYVRTKTPEQTEDALRKKLPKRFWIEYNALLVVWGQNMCKPISPFCSRCRIFPLCPRRGVGTKR
jgi:endonuclease-3